jgi:hypothetical protein
MTGKNPHFVYFIKHSNKIFFIYLAWHCMLSTSFIPSYHSSNFSFLHSLSSFCISSLSCSICFLHSQFKSYQSSTNKSVIFLGQTGNTILQSIQILSYISRLKFKHQILG